MIISYVRYHPVGYFVNKLHPRGDIIKCKKMPQEREVPINCPLTADGPAQEIGPSPDGITICADLSGGKVLPLAFSVSYEVFERLSKVLAEEGLSPVWTDGTVSFQAVYLSGNPQEESTLPNHSISLLTPEQEAEFTKMYESSIEPISTYVHNRLWGSKQDAEDIIQNVFFRASRSFADFTVQDTHSANPYMPWLYKIAHNLLANHYRVSRQRTLEPLDEIPEDSESNTIFSYQPTMDTGLENEERLVQLRHIINSLSNNQRSVIGLHIAFGLTFPKIDGIFGSTEGIFKSRFHRAIVNLRKLTVADK